MDKKKADQRGKPPLADVALACLAQGDAVQAESLLRAHLRLNPLDADGWHAMACVARAGGNAGAAVALADKAVGLVPEPFFHITLGLALLELGHVEPARAAANVAAIATPNDPRAHDAMGQILEKAGRLADAERALKKALALRPLEQERHMALAAFLARCGRVGEAVTLSARALALEEGNIAARNLHAMVLEQAGRMVEAEPHFRRVAQAMPNNPEALANHGAALFAQQRYEAAEQALRLSATLAPDVAETRTNLGLVLMAQGRLHGAEHELGAAYRLRTGDARLALNYGTVMMDLGHTQAAEELFTQAMQQATTPRDHARAALNLGSLCLSTGQFAKGWDLFEARTNLLLPPACVAAMPEWDGAVSAQTVLLYAEQGLGDALQFLRYVGLAAQKVRICLLVPQTMRSFVQALLPQWGGRVQLVMPEQAGGAQACCSLLSLPHRLGVAAPFAWQPDTTCFVGPTAPHGRGKVRVGLCWSGNPRYQFDRRRSLDPALLGGLAAVDGLSLQALQPCVPPADSPVPLTPLPKGDLLATAQIIAGLDAVVSVDTMIVHLAGLLGKPTLLLDRYGGDWRWAAGSVAPDTPLVADAGLGPGVLERSLWYPSVRITRQPAPRDDRPSWRIPLATAALWLEHVAARAVGPGGCSHAM
ncbi:tetratricopeptide repeat protein [Acetobacter lambici]|uniref:Tetratricopeptide repeat protein n=1 Tax=Acetobacter lambici TaxID=1332824 RepID=A0ABT1EX90_9PROT|nr:tetratricopeptide repeat protein [Acetobacter lambici]MCP1241447.1 tetratricopeptide repeat protein [Acetobacter lambici]MCP1257571.1 tetratricopeptide repeat protein [Acetobacter lambici]NHO55951.1 tetratricopeptide repeat protein [Acetobacter lambici]